MSGIGIASLTFVCAFGGAILGNYTRAAIPPAAKGPSSSRIRKTAETVSERNRPNACSAREEHDDGTLELPRPL